MEGLLVPLLLSTLSFNIILGSPQVVPQDAYANEDISEGICSKWVNECLDDSYPNIGQGFRGYNVILGDPLDHSGDPGYRAHIFDESKERAGAVRFGNLAGNDLNRCDGSVTADFLETHEDLFSSIVTTEGETTGSSVGPELEISGGIEEGPASFMVSRTIPPLYQSLGSNSKVMKDLSSRLSYRNQKVTRSVFNCYEYEFSIYNAEHPALTGNFADKAEYLDACLHEGGSVISYDSRTSTHDSCVKEFFENFGTHYIKYAKSGSKETVISVLSAEITSTLTQDQIATCAAQDSRWSFLGFFGGGSVTKTCKDSAFNNASSQSSLKESDILLTVGSRPKSDYSEWASQTGKPEVIFKKVSPISELFTKDFMKKLSIMFEPNNTASIKVLLEQYIAGYCGLFPSHCKYVTRKSFCMDMDMQNTFNPTKSKYTHCVYDCLKYDKTCGFYTGPVDIDFLPHGNGTFLFVGKTLLLNFVHGLATGEVGIKPENTGGCFEEGVGWDGIDINNGDANPQADPEACQKNCKASAECEFFTFNEETSGCWLHSSRGTPKSAKHLTRGPRDCGQDMIF